MLHATWNRILHGRGRLVLTVLAVALGVTFLTAALVLSGSASAAMTDSYAQVYAGSDVIVRGPAAAGGGVRPATAPLPDDTLRRILASPEVAGAEARYSSVAQLLTDDDGASAVALAVPDDPGRASIEVRTGDLPAGAGEIAVDAAVAAQHDLSIGDRVEVLLPTGVHEARIVGTVGFGRLDGLAGGARILFDATTTDDRFGGEVTEIAVRATAGTSAERLAQHLAASLDDGLQVDTAAEAAARDAAAAARQTAAVSWVVLAVAVIALVIGAFLIANTFRMLVAQRTRELALLRALGADRRQVARSIRLEAAITGAAGSVVGVLLGLGAGALLVSTSSGLLPGMPPTSPTLTPVALVAGPVVGVGVALLAGRGAARRALAISPVEAMRTATTTDTGSAAASPVTRILAVISRPLEHAGVAGSLARQQALAAPRRTGATAAALAVTLALIGYLLVISASLGAATSDVLAARQHAELQISSSAPQGLHDAFLGVADQADAMPGVAAARVVTYGELEIVDGGTEDARPVTANVYVVDPAAADLLFDVEDRGGDLGRLAPGEIAVRRTAAVVDDRAIGDRLTVRFPDGTSQELTIGALFEGGITSDWIVAPATADDHLGAAYREVFVKLDEGATTQEVQPRLERLVRDVPGADVSTRAELAEQIASESASYLGILTALFALSLVVGVLGVVNTLTLAVYDRVREIGLLRAVGATRSQVRAMIRWEAAVTSLLGAVLGTTLGLVAAWITVTVLPETAMTYTVPVTHLAAAALATALLGVVASVLPARRAARIDVLRAVAAT